MKRLKSTRIEHLEERTLLSINPVAGDSEWELLFNSPKIGQTLRDWVVADSTQPLVHSLKNEQQAKFSSPVDLLQVK